MPDPQRLPTEPPPRTPGACGTGARPTPPCARLDSAQLFGARREIEIDHCGAVYRLRITSQGKLILTK